MEDNEFEEVTIISSADKWWTPLAVTASVGCSLAAALSRMKRSRIEVTQKIGPNQNIKYTKKSSTTVAKPPKTILSGYSRVLSEYKPPAILVAAGIIKPPDPKTQVFRDNSAGFYKHKSLLDLLHEESRKKHKTAGPNPPRHHFVARQPSFDPAVPESTYWYFDRHRTGCYKYEPAKQTLDAVKGLRSSSWRNITPWGPYLVVVANYGLDFYHLETMQIISAVNRHIKMCPTEVIRVLTTEQNLYIVEACGIVHMFDHNLAYTKMNFFSFVNGLPSWAGKNQDPNKILIDMSVSKKDKITFLTKEGELISQGIGRFILEPANHSPKSTCSIKFKPQFSELRPTFCWTRFLVSSFTLDPQTRLHLLCSSTLTPVHSLGLSSDPLSPVQSIRLLLPRCGLQAVLLSQSRSVSLVGLHRDRLHWGACAGLGEGVLLLGGVGGREGGWLCAAGEGLVCLRVRL